MAPESNSIFSSWQRGLAELREARDLRSRGNSADGVITGYFEFLVERKLADASSPTAPACGSRNVTIGCAMEKKKEEGTKKRRELHPDSLEPSPFSTTLRQVLNTVGKQVRYYIHLVWCARAPS